MGVTSHVLDNEWDVLLSLNDVDVIDANATVVLMDATNADNVWIATVVVVVVAFMLIVSL